MAEKQHLPSEEKEKKKKRKENNGAEKAREVKHGEHTVEKAWSALFYQ